MSAPFVAEIRIWGCNFAPTGWAFCNGQLLPLSQNTALFSLLGTNFGGDGKSTFGLPNMQGNVPIHVGGNQPGPGLSEYFIGQSAGVPQITLPNKEMPAHSHSLSASEENNNENNVQNNFFGAGETRYAAPNNLLAMAPQALSLAGGNGPHNNMMPYLVLNYCIALQGVFPPRT